MGLQVANEKLRKSILSASNKILTAGGDVVASGQSDGEPVDLDGGRIGVNSGFSEGFSDAFGGVVLDSDGNYSTAYGHFNIIPESKGYMKVQYKTGSISIIPVWEGREVMGSIVKVFGDDTTVRKFYAFV